MGNSLHINEQAWSDVLKRLTNKIFKLLPLREENAEWEKELSVIALELRGLAELDPSNSTYVIILSKIHGLIEEEDFLVYRKTIFDIMTLLGDLK